MIMFKKQFQKLKKDQKGLTLVELLAVVVILAIVAAIAFVVIGNVIDNTRKDAHVSNAQQIINAVKVAEATGDVKEKDLTAGFDVISFTTGAEGGSGTSKQNLNIVGNLDDPWDKEAYKKALVQKVEGKYQIQLTTKESSTNTKCQLDAAYVPEKVLQEGRSKACGYTPKTP